jgi:hypothetical protein
MIEMDLLLNFLSLFVPAMIGVGGTYHVYKKRQEDTKSNLREAFLSEMEGTEFLENWPTTSGSVPFYKFLSVSVYESNTDKFGLLSEQEVSAIVRYYSRAKSIQDFLNIHSDLIVRNKSLIVTDNKYADRKATLRDAIDKLEISRIRAMQYIRKNTEDAAIPQQGDKVSDFGFINRSKLILLLEYGLVENDQADGFIITSDGSDFFENELMMTGMEKTADIMGREKTTAKKVLEFLWNGVQRIIDRV